MKKHLFQILLGVVFILFFFIILSVRLRVAEKWYGFYYVDHDPNVTEFKSDFKSVDECNTWGQDMLIQRVSKDLPIEDDYWKCANNCSITKGTLTIKCSGFGETFGNRDGIR